jgi:hypothetical protein
MKTGHQITKYLKNRGLKKALWILFPLLFCISLFFLISEIVPVIIGLIFFSLSIMVLSVIYVITERYYNWPVYFIVIFMVGLLYKSQHWPFAGIMLTTGIFFLCFVCLINSVRFQLIFTKNPFLRWFGSISCIIVSFYMLGLLFKIQHWGNFISQIMGYTGVVMFIISILGMVFTLPTSNYISWSAIEKKTFFRAVLVPMCIVFTLIIITLVFGDLFYFIMRGDGSSWDLNKSFDLFDLEGIQKI